MCIDSLRERGFYFLLLRAYFRARWHFIFRVIIWASFIRNSVIVVCLIFFTHQHDLFTYISLLSLSIEMSHTCPTPHLCWALASVTRRWLYQSHAKLNLKLMPLSHISETEESSLLLELCNWLLTLWYQVPKCTAKDKFCLTQVVKGMVKIDHTFLFFFCGQNHLT